MVGVFIWSLITTKLVVVIRDASGRVYLVLLDPTRLGLVAPSPQYFTYFLPPTVVRLWRCVGAIEGDVRSTHILPPVQLTRERRSSNRDRSSRSCDSASHRLQATAGPTGLDHKVSRSGTFPAWLCRDVNDARAAAHFALSRSFASAIEDDSLGGGKIRESSFLTGTSRV